VPSIVGVMMAEPGIDAESTTVSVTSTSGPEQLKLAGSMVTLLPVSGPGVGLGVGFGVELGFGVGFAVGPQVGLAFAVLAEDGPADWPGPATSVNDPWAST
jgi:hypothetical protein